MSALAKYLAKASPEAAGVGNRLMRAHILDAFEGLGSKRAAALGSEFRKTEGHLMDLDLLPEDQRLDLLRRIMDKRLEAEQLRDNLRGY